MPVTVRRFVDVSSPAGGNGLTPDVSGSNRAFNSIRTALTQLTASFQDLVALDTILEIECRGYDLGGAFYTPPGYVTDETRYILVKNPTGFLEDRFTSSSTSYTIAVGPAVAGVLTLDNVKNIRFQGVQFENASTNGVWGVIQSNPTSSDYNYSFENCYIRSVSGSGNNGTAIFISGAIRKSIIMNNCIIEGQFSNAIGLSFISAGSLPTILTNNTFIGSGFSVTENGNVSITLRNNIVSSSNTNYVLTNSNNVTSSNNISSDNSSPNTQLRGLVPQFTNRTQRNYVLSSLDTVAMGRGTNITSSISRDCRGVIRRGTWDIGAYQNNVSRISTQNTPLVFIDNFDRPDSGSLGPNYLNISGGLAIFSGSVRSTNVLNRRVSYVNPNVMQFSSDQEASITYRQTFPFDFAGLVVRANETNTMYFVEPDGRDGRQEATITRMVSGSTTGLSVVDTYPLNPNDRLTLRAAGNVISLFRNGILISRVTDNTITSGQPGMIYRWENQNTTQLDNFVAANVTSTSPDNLCIISNTGNTFLITPP